GVHLYEVLLPHSCTPKPRKIPGLRERNVMRKRSQALRRASAVPTAPNPTIRTAVATSLPARPPRPSRLRIDTGFPNVRIGQPFSCASLRNGLSGLTAWG